MCSKEGCSHIEIWQDFGSRGWYWVYSSIGVRFEHRLINHVSVSAMKKRPAGVQGGVGKKGVQYAQKEKKDLQREQEDLRSTVQGGGWQPWFPSFACESDTRPPYEAPVMVCLAGGAHRFPNIPFPNLFYPQKIFIHSDFFLEIQRAVATKAVNMGVGAAPDQGWRKRGRPGLPHPSL